MIKKIECNNTTAVDKDKRVANNTASILFFILKALLKPPWASVKHGVYTGIHEHFLCSYSRHFQKMALFEKLS